MKNGGPILVRTPVVDWTFRAVLSPVTRLITPVTDIVGGFAWCLRRLLLVVCWMHFYFITEYGEGGFGVIKFACKMKWLRFYNWSILNGSSRRIWKYVHLELLRITITLPLLSNKNYLLANVGALKWFLMGSRVTLYGDLPQGSSCLKVLRELFPLKIGEKSC